MARRRWLARLQAIRRARRSDRHVDRAGIGDGPPRGDGNGLRDGIGDGVRNVGPGVTTPIVIQQVKPQYTADAMRAKVQGSVWLECVVMPDGTVGDVRVTRSLDPMFGLDQEAIAAANGGDSSRNREWQAGLATLDRQNE